MKAAFPLVIVGFLAQLTASHAADAPHASLDSKHRVFFKDYCVECHNEKKQKGKLRLDDISFTLDSVENADRWQKILNQINSGEMPPEDSKQPERVAKTEFLDSLSHTLMAARRTLGDSGGKITMRRLNRREYKNTIRDLLGVDINVRELPADGGAGTFDTVGSSLFMSSDQFEQYLALGRQALDEHFARFVAPSGAKPRLMHVEVEEKNAKIAKSLADRTDAHERYEKWTAAVNAAAQKPENASLATQIRAEKKGDDRHFYSQWQRIKGAPSPKEFGFTDEIHADEQGRRNWVRSVPYQRAYLEHPATKTGTFLTIEDVFVNPYQPFRLPGDWPAGDYVVRVRIAATSNTPASRHFVEFGSQHDSGVRAVASSHQVTGTMEKPQVLEIPLKFSPAKGYGFFFQEKGTYESEDVAHRLFAEGQKANGIGPEFALWIDWIEVVSKDGVPTQTQAEMQKIHREPEEQANKEVAASELAFGKSMEHYQKWKSAVDEAAKLPENAALVAELQALPRVKTHPPVFYQFWAQRKPEPSPKTFGFPDGEEAEFQRGQYRKVNYVKDYLALPLKDKGAYLFVQNVHPIETIAAPASWPAGEYRLRVRIGAVAGSPAERRFLQVGQVEPSSKSFAPLSTHQITGSTEQPVTLEIPVQLSVNGNRSFALREKTDNKGEIAYRMWQEEDIKTGGHGPAPALWIDWMEIEGPVSSSAPITKTEPTKQQKLRKDPEQWANKYMPIYAEGYVEKYSRFQKWCAAIDEAAKKPEHAAEVAKLRADPRLKTQPHLFYSGFAKLKDAPQPSQFGFKDVDDAQFARSEYTYHHQYYADYAKLPQRETGSWLMLYSLGRYTGIAAPNQWPAGKYTLRVRLAASDESPKERRFIEIGTGKADAADFNVLSSHQVTGTLAQPQTLEIPVEINASGDRNFAIRDKRPNTREAEYAMFREAWDKTGTGPRPCIWVDYVEVEGPTNAVPPSPAAPKTIKERREAERMANNIVSGTYNGYYKGGYEVAKAYLDSDRSKPPSAFGKGIADEQEAKFRVRVFGEHGPSFERYLNDPLTKTGSLLTIYNVHTEEVIALPPDPTTKWDKNTYEPVSPGDYMLRFRIGAVKGTPKERHFVALGSRKAGDEDFTLMQTFQISGTTDAPQIIEVPVSITAEGPHTFVLREKRDVKLDHELYTAAQKATGVGPMPALWIDWVEWEGPLMKQAPIAKTTRIEPETRRADVERGHLRFKFLNEQYGKWKAAGGDEAKLKDFGFTDKSHGEFAKIVWDSNNHWFQQYLDRPLSKTGLYLDNTVQETSEHVIDLPADLPTGDYVFRVNIGCVPDMPKERAFLSFVKASPIDKDDRTLLETRQITADLAHPQTIELPFRIEPNGARKFIFMEKRPLKKEAISLPGRTRLIKDAKQRDPVLWIDWIEWQGPLLKQSAPLVKTHRYEPERKTAELKQKIVSINDSHEKYQQWKASGGNKEDLSKYGFQSDKQADVSELTWQGNHDWFQRYVDRPKAETGMFIDNTINETSEFLVDLPRDLATGDYVFRVKVGRVPDMPMERAFLSLAQVNPIDVEARTFITSRQITADYDHPEVIELPFHCVSGGSRRFIFAERRPLIRIDFGLAGKTRLIEDPKQRDPVLWIDWIEWEGPLNKTDTKTAPTPVLFANTTSASERDHARGIIEKFAKRAFRDKPPTDDYLSKLTALFDTRRKAGDAFDIAIKTPLSVVLASPRFLYLSEPAEEKKPRALTAPELATRLSYFLWSAPPDDTLLALSLSGNLMKPDVLAHEVDRMIASEKADEFVSGFVHQWLGMERLDFFQFDTKQFRDFDESAKAAARREVYETFAHLLRTNGSARDLLKCDYVLVNGLLATYYGIDGVSGDEFRKVSLPKDSPRGGLLGMAAVLAMGSNGERTSPVERGAWVLRKLLHDPPPPAPPNVPQITRLNGQPLTTRERLLAHQEEPQCASCHRAIDPIGFGLENFNAAGKWRVEDSFQAVDANGRPAKNGLKTWTIDPSAAFHKGPAFNDYFELRNIVASKSPAFARGFTESLIQYALGRPFGFADEELATNIVQHAQEKEFVIREIVQALVASKAFQIK